ncbi:FtsB family cell division protein [Salinicoccus halitifaciens]|uniref:Cell division protein DivIC n=1 Tax=Salinicoccus halitifaciens TaxID=1073415 RepID=A0ABV2E9U4_9STAP|nr:septum formation initiator family protein [Salinicoccus halitifaciens]MCD2138318.1 septum formation initiator family protein [Salinicoccus halitifaciens]
MRNGRGAVNNKVVKLLNNYTRKKESEKKVLTGEQRVSRRRTVLVSSLMLVVAGILLVMALHQHNQNSLLKEEVVSNEEILENKITEARDLEQQIKQLNDDNYIMRIARSEFFLSEEGEIIFNLSEGNDDESVTTEDGNGE